MSDDREGGAAIAKPKIQTKTTTVTKQKQKQKQRQRQRTSDPINRRDEEFEDAPMYRLMLLGDEEYDVVHVVERMCAILDDMDEDDFDLFSDDSDMSDAENRNMIFCTLQDSGAVLPRLAFHREVSGCMRLPRPLPKQTETYENLFRLFVEIELLLKVWKKRVEHPYTAHLQPTGEKSKESDSSPGRSPTCSRHLLTNSEEVMGR